MLIVYRKSDKEILFNSGKSFVEPQGMSDENGKLAVMEQIGGIFEDYGVYRLHDVIDIEKVNEILKYPLYTTLMFEEGEVVGYVIDYTSFESDKILREEKELIDSLIPTKEEILIKEVDTLLQKVNEQKEENQLLKAQIKANSDISDFHEELLFEIAMMVYQ